MQRLAFALVSFILTHPIFAHKPLVVSTTSVSKYGYEMMTTAVEGHARTSTSKIYCLCVYDDSPERIPGKKQLQIDPLFQKRCEIDRTHLIPQTCDFFQTMPKSSWDTINKRPEPNLVGLTGYRIIYEGHSIAREWALRSAAVFSFTKELPYCPDGYVEVDTGCGPLWDPLELIEPLQDVLERIETNFPYVVILGNQLIAPYEVELNPTSQTPIQITYEKDKAPVIQLSPCYPPGKACFQNDNDSWSCKPENRASSVRQA